MMLAESVTSGFTVRSTHAFTHSRPTTVSLLVAVDLGSLIAHRRHVPPPRDATVIFAASDASLLQ